MTCTLFRLRTTTKLSSGLILLAAGFCRADELFLVSAHGQNSTNEVYRYSVAGPTSAATYRLTITDANLLQPFGVAFDTAGEMFVTNRASFGGTPSIARSVHPLASSPVFDSTYTDSTFHFPHFIASWHDKLFVIQTSVSGLSSDPGSLSRYAIQPNQAPMLDGQILNLTGIVRGVAVHPVTGEVFVSQCCSVNRIDRYIFDSSGNATPNGNISGNGLSNPHGMAFSQSGELFVANPDGASISRFRFDSTGAAIPNGFISGNYGAMGVAFAPWGELFVSSHFQPTVYRWTFDQAGNATSNGSFSTPQTLGGLAFDPVGQYNVCLLFDPTKAVQSGATVPVKLQLCDSNGNNLSSSALTVHATIVTMVSSSISGQVQDSGNANPDSDFRFDASLGTTVGYIFNLSTKGLTTGTYSLNFTVSGDSFTYSVLFQVK
jgi:hypothetical protein